MKKFSDFLLKEPDYDKLIGLYTKLEFNSFLKKLKIDVTPRRAVSGKGCGKKIIDKAADLNALESFAGQDVFLKVFGAKGHATDPIIDGVLFMCRDEAILVDAAAVPVADLIAVIEQTQMRFYGHEIKDDVYCLMFYGLEDVNVVFDTSIAEYVLDPSRNKYELKSLALERLKTDMGDISEDTEGQIDMFEDPRRKMLDTGVRIGLIINRLIEREKNPSGTAGPDESLFRSRASADRSPCFHGKGRHQSQQRISGNVRNGIKRQDLTDGGKHIRPCRQRI